MSYDEGKTYTEDNEEVYWGNITHNLGKMVANVSQINAVNDFKHEIYETVQF